jgi:hypothetical protein
MKRVAPKEKRYHTAASNSRPKGYERPTLSKNSHLNEPQRASSTESQPRKGEIGDHSTLQNEELTVGPQCYPMKSLICQKYLVQSQHKNAPHFSFNRQDAGRVRTASGERLGPGVGAYDIAKSDGSQVTKSP